MSCMQQFSASTSEDLMNGTAGGAPLRKNTGKPFVNCRSGCRHRPARATLTCLSSQLCTATEFEGNLMNAAYQQQPIIPCACMRVKLSRSSGALAALLEIG